MRAVYKVTDILLLGLHSLAVHKFRSFLTALGILFGVWSVIAMLAINEGASYESQLALRQMGTGTQPSLWLEMDKIKNPVLFIAGEKDEKFKALAYEMSDLCERAEISIIKNCGHNVHFEQPLEFYEQLYNFLKK